MWLLSKVQTNRYIFVLLAAFWLYHGRFHFSVFLLLNPQFFQLFFHTCGNFFCIEASIPYRSNWYSPPSLFLPPSIPPSGNSSTILRFHFQYLLFIHSLLLLLLLEALVCCCYWWNMEAVCDFFFNSRKPSSHAFFLFLCYYRIILY